MEQQEIWDYEKAYTYALKLISRQACSVGRIKERLSKKTSLDITEDVLAQIQAHNLIDDMQLCFDTASMWVQKKPISRIQLIQKLTSYGFAYFEIQKSLHSLEQTYAQMRDAHEEDEVLSYVGGMTIDRLQEVYDDIYSLSLWNTLALASCIQMKILDYSVDYMKIKRRLQLRGYSVDSQTKSVIQVVVSDDEI